MNELQIFENAEFGRMRIIIIDGEPWFAGKDAAEALGYKNTKDVLINHVENEDKRIIQRSEISTFENHIPKSALPVNFVAADIPNRGLTIINESGLYSLILSSKLPKAKEFKHWITSEVIPSIRKHGVYAVKELVNDPDFLIKVLIELKTEQTKNKEFECEIERLKPSADYTDVILNNKSLVTITQIAKDYGMSGAKMNMLLSKKKVQYKQSGQWLLYSEYQDKGYVHSKTINITRTSGADSVVMETKWTQKGRLFIYNLLKKDGICPLIEKNTKTVKKD